MAELFEELNQKSKLDNLLAYLIWGEETYINTTEDPEQVLNMFWDRAEKEFPGLSRNNDRFFKLIVDFSSDVGAAYFKAGFLSGFSLAQEIATAKDIEDRKSRSLS